MGAPQAISATDEAVPQWHSAVADQPPSYQLVPEDAGNDTDPDIEISEDAIRQRSQQIWEREGRPEGYAEDHWQRARAELAALMARTSNAQLTPHPADDAALPLESSGMVLEAPPSVPVPDTEPEIVDDAGQSEPQPLLLQDVLISPLPEDAVAVRPQPRPLPEAGQLSETAVVPSIISTGFVMRGALESTGDIQFDGVLDGDIYSVSLTVGEEAVIRGEVIADKVMVRGRVLGNIRARRVYLFATARIEGDIQYGALAVESGAQLDGSFQMIIESAPLA